LSLLCLRCGHVSFFNPSLTSQQFTLFISLCCGDDCFTPSLISPQQLTPCVLRTCYSIVPFTQQFHIFSCGHTKCMYYPSFTSQQFTSFALRTWLVYPSPHHLTLYVAEIIVLPCAHFSSAVHSVFTLRKWLFYPSFLTQHFTYPKLLLWLFVDFTVHILTSIYMLFIYELNTTVYRMYISLLPMVSCSLERHWKKITSIVLLYILTSFSIFPIVLLFKKTVRILSINHLQFHTVSLVLQY
jgi:hypothetical protein